MQSYLFNYLTAELDITLKFNVKVLNYNLELYKNYFMIGTYSTFNKEMMSKVSTVACSIITCHVHCLCVEDCLQNT